MTDGDVDPTCGQALVAAGYDRDFGELAGSGPISPTKASPVPGWRSVHLDLPNRTVQLAHGAELDLGATAKAWSADRCARLIAAEVDVGVLVSLGGDIAVAGPPPGDGWHVQTTDNHAAQADADGQTVTIISGGLATSSTTVRAWEAGGRRMHHIIDPRTGEPVSSRWRTVSGGGRDLRRRQHRQHSGDHQKRCRPSLADRAGPARAAGRPRRHGHHNPRLARR